MLFANSDIGFYFCVFLICVIAAVYYGFRGYMALYHPQAYSEMCQREHEREMQAGRLKAMQEMQKKEEEAARHKRNGALLGIGGSLLKVFFGR